MGLYVPKPLSIVEAKRLPVFGGNRNSTDDVDAHMQASRLVAEWCNGVFHADPVLDNSLLEHMTIYGKAFTSPGCWIVRMHRAGEEFTTFSHKSFVDTYIDLEVSE